MSDSNEKPASGHMNAESPSRSVMTGLSNQTVPDAEKATDYSNQAREAQQIQASIDNASQADKELLIAAAELSCRRRENRASRGQWS